MDRVLREAKCFATVKHSENDAPPKDERGWRQQHSYTGRQSRGNERFLELERRSFQKPGATRCIFQGIYVGFSMQLRRVTVTESVEN